MSAKKLSDKQVLRLWRSAREMAITALADEPGSFTDRSDLIAATCAFLAGGFVSPDGPMPRKTTHAGADADQDAKLNEVYGDE